MPPPDLRGLYAVTPDCGDGASLLAGVAAALAGGCRIVQYRDKTSAMAERVARARALREITRRHDARLVINDDIALCCLSDADGVHLGRDDGDLRNVRRLLGPDRILGASCYADFDCAVRAAAAGVDYIAFGAAFPSPTKPDAPPVAVDLYRRAKTNLAPAVCAIGGITADNAEPLVDAGVDLLAVSTDLFSAADIAVRAARYQRLFERATP
ncbi:MAG: thiamine phosphate synthase [Betaproteobacteria bacterium]|nr:thiamine phosphate synthase [Betaproteobacteria bacterium]